MRRWQGRKEPEISSFFSKCPESPAVFLQKHHAPSHDEDDGRANGRRQGRIDSVEADLGQNRGQCRKQGGQKSIYKPHSILPHLFIKIFVHSLIRRYISSILRTPQAKPFFTRSGGKYSSYLSKRGSSFGYMSSIGSKGFCISSARIAKNSFSPACMVNCL